VSAARALFAAQIYVVWHTVKGPAGHSFHENGLPLENEWDRLAGPCEDFYEEVVIGDPRKQHIEFVKTLEGLPPGATLLASSCRSRTRSRTRTRARWRCPSRRRPSRRR